MKSRSLPDVDEPALPLRLRRSDQALDERMVIAQPTLLGAIKLCVSVAGFESDKQVYGSLDIDPGHWTRITRGEAHFPVDKLPALMDLCGNEAPLMWLTHSRGYDVGSLRKRESDLERRNRELTEENAALRRVLMGSTP